MTIKTGANIFESVGRYHILLENWISISVKHVGRRIKEVV